MSSAPPGWHLQPDGRERFWDGERWTDEFRDPSSSPTQAIPTTETRGMPQRDSGDDWPRPAPAPSPGGFEDRYHEYFEPGGPLSDRPNGRGTPGWLKGCGAVLVGLLVLAVLGVLGGWWLFNRDSDEGGTGEPAETTATTDPPVEPTSDPPAEPTEDATEEPTEESTGLPTAWPSGVPTEFPTVFPTALPTDFPRLPTLPGLPGLGESVEVAPGESFTLGPAQIQAGWEARVTLGLRTVSMTSVSTQSSQVPIVFTLVFFQDGTEIASTICTAPVATVGEEADVTCVPMRGAVENADTVRASGVGG